MKATGVVRKVDDLGRVVIPKELRKILNINEGDALEIFTENETIILRKYNPGCSFCGEIDGVKDVKGIKICPKCIEAIKKL